jgi:hypothetical protein
MVELLAAASRMTAAVPTPSKPAPVPGGAPTTAAPALATPNAVVVAPQNAASDFVTSAYQFIQYWVDYGVELADWALGWIPGGYLIGDQINIFYFNLVRPVADTVVYNLINPVLNAPLNLSVWANGIVDVGWSVVAGAVNTGIAEANYFLGWILPPLPSLPFPPLPFAATAQTTALSAVAPAQTLSTTLAGLRETLADAFKGLTEGASLLNAADVKAPGVKAKPADVGETPAVTDGEKNPVQNVITDIETAAPAAALPSTADQVKDATTQTDDVTTVPKSVRQSLQSPKPATADKSVGTSRQTRIKDVRDGVRSATADLKANVQKATDGLRNAVKGVGKTTADTNTGTKTKADSKTDKPANDKSDKSDKSDSD